MLRTLTIRNYTLIDALDIEFERGLTVITGETGAGKSIVLDALGLALGNRADARALRAGAERLEVAAGFDVTDTPAAAAWLRERELDQGEECQLRRVVTRDGRSRSWINGQAATLADLKTLGDQLVDMHGQHEHHSLLERATQQALLDACGGHADLVRRVRQAYQAWKDCRDEADALRRSAAERNDRAQLLNYQLGELRELALGPGEAEQLERDQRLLAGAAELGADLDNLLAACENERGGLLGALRHAVVLAARLSALGERADNVRQLLDSALIQVDEARHDLLALQGAIEINPQRLRDVEERLATLVRIARKHRIDPHELPALEQRLAEEASALEGSTSRLEAIDTRLAELLAAWDAAATALGKARRKAAKDIAARVRQQLALLGMETCVFEVALKPAGSQPAALGAEQVEFLVSTNPGSSPEPLARIASGGELSRISLAIQVITASRAVTPTVIFDEVDVGIGGATADAVGSLLQTLGERIQVLCVTHLPQVAARGHQHLKAVKTTAKDSTSARLLPQDGEDRVTEIARMLAGRTVTSKSRDHATEMLQAAAGA